LHELTLHPDERQDLTRRERAFIRAVVQHDYEQQMARRICPSQAMFMKQFPSWSFFTDFDYVWGRAEINVKPVYESPVPEAYRAEWVSFASRAKRSGGRMEFHLITLIEGSKPRYWLVPLRTNSSSVYKGLKKIAAKYPMGMSEGQQQAVLPALREDVQHLLKEEEERWQAIH
jgi:hypothetical protein